MEGLSKTINKKQRELIITNDGVYGLLGLKSNNGFTIEGRYFNNMLQYYYFYLATNNTSLQNSIMKVKTTAGLNIIYGNKYGYKTCTPELHIYHYNWKRSIKILIRGLKSKINQNPDVKMILISTGDCYIKYQAGNDMFLGCGFDNKGLNLLGILLMMIRDEILKKKDTSSTNLFHNACFHLNCIEIAQPYVMGNPLNIIYESDEDDDYN